MYSSETARQDQYNVNKTKTKTKSSKPVEKERKIVGICKHVVEKTAEWGIYHVSCTNTADMGGK